MMSLLTDAAHNTTYTLITFTSNAVQLSGAGSVDVIATSVGRRPGGSNFQLVGSVAGKCAAGY